MTNVQTVDNALDLLLQTAKDFSGASLDICTGYISTSGILSLQSMLKSASTPRAIVGLNPTNRLNAFRKLRALGVQVYIYVAPPRTLFHPKIYFGASGTQAWAMIGSSNLTESGMLNNIEHNLLITGQRHIEPFSSIEARIEAFIKQSYPFDHEFEKRLLEVERKMMRGSEANRYDEYLTSSGIIPKEKLEQAIPVEVQRVALETLYKFSRSTRLEYAYQMLLLLIMLYAGDENGWFSVEKAARYFIEFYRLRREAGLLPEKKRGNKLAVADNPHTSVAEMCEMVKTNPFPRFERQGLLELSEDGQYFVTNGALLKVLTLEVKNELRAIAIERLAEHFDESTISLSNLLETAFG